MTENNKRYDTLVPDQTYDYYDLAIMHIVGGQDDNKVVRLTKKPEQSEDNIISGSYERKRRILEDYRKKHTRCPNCGNASTSQTLMGFVLNLDDPDSYRDENNASCRKCGWSGTVHELLPE